MKFHAPTLLLFTQLVILRDKKSWLQVLTGFLFGAKQYFQSPPYNNPEAMDGVDNAVEVVRDIDKDGQNSWDISR